MKLKHKTVDLNEVIETVLNGENENTSFQAKNYSIMLKKSNPENYRMKTFLSIIVNNDKKAYMIEFKKGFDINIDYFSNLFTYPEYKLVLFDDNILKVEIIENESIFNLFKLSKESDNNFYLNFD